jgi:hypothetical protein
MVENPVADGQLQDGITEKLQPLVVHDRITRLFIAERFVGQGLLRQKPVLKPVADLLFKIVQKIVLHSLSSPHGVYCANKKAGSNQRRFPAPDLPERLGEYIGKRTAVQFVYGRQPPAIGRLLTPAALSP